MNRREFVKLGGLYTVSLLLNSCDIKLDINDYIDNEDENCGVPDYYFKDDYIKKKIERINYLISKGECDSFCFITDTHWEYNSKKSPFLLKYLNRNTSLRRLFVGGDIGDVYGRESFECIKALEMCWDGEIHCVVGNHEYLGNTISTEEEVRTLFETNPLVQKGNLLRHYYYVDDDVTHTRYIILASYAQRKEGNYAATVGYETEQLNWFKEEALNVTEGTTIIIFTHLLYYIEPDDDSISCPYFVEPVIDIIDSYSGPGKINCVIQGHNHRDRIVYTPNRIPVIITTCDKMKKMGGEQMRSSRHGGTIEEQAFDVFIINKSLSVINVVRIGGRAENGIGNEKGSNVEERIINN